jgi:signal peptidase I
MKLSQMVRRLRSTSEPKKRSRKSVLREYYEAILVAFILALFVRTFVFENFKIPSGSMEDNLLVGDHLVVNKFIFSQHADTFLHKLFPYRSPARGDVVVFKYPENPRRDFIKRCVAVAGDTVELRARRVKDGSRTRIERTLYINGEPQGDAHVVYKLPKGQTVDIIKDQRDVFPPRDPRARYSLGQAIDDQGAFIVPEGTIFCLGDNRNNSLDSRYWGPVPLTYVKGRAVLIYWSYEAERNDWQWRGWGHRFKQLAEVVLHFFTKTRWERQFRLIE